METKLATLQEAQILRGLEQTFKVREVKYDILNYRFDYIKGEEHNQISLEQLLSHLYQDVPKDEVLLTLWEVADGLLPEYLNEQFTSYYDRQQITIPSSIYIFKGLVQYIDSDGDEYFVPFDRPLVDVFKQLDKIKVD